MSPQNILAALNDLNPDAALFDNMHTALIGVGRSGTADPVAVYSQFKIFERLYADGFSEAEALDYFSDKMVAFDAGANTPVIVLDMEINEE